MVKTKVTLISYSPDMERVCASAMRSCYSQFSATELFQKKELLSQENVTKMLEKAIALGHYDVLEHASLTFCMENVSRALTHQLVRHRLASYSQQSQRHVKIVKDDWFIKPKSFNDKDKIHKINGMKSKLDYDAFMSLSKQIYHMYVDMGVHKQDARFILPSACITNITITTNPREFRHIFGLRCDSTSQWEIQDVCWAMLSTAKLVAPTIFKTLPPPAGKDESAIEKCHILDKILLDYINQFEKTSRGDIIEIDLDKLNLFHKVQSNIIKY